MRKRPSKDIAPDYYELKCTLAMAFILQNGIDVIFFRGGGGGVLEDDSTQRLRGKPYNKVAIFLHRFILLV